MLKFLFLNSYSHKYKKTICQIIKEAKAINVDLNLIRDCVCFLFKFNLPWQAQKKKTKELKNKDYNSITNRFGRLLTCEKAQKRRNAEIKKTQKAKQKKKAIEVKQIVIIVKKQTDEIVRGIEQTKIKKKKLIKVKEVITQKNIGRKSNC